MSHFTDLFISSRKPQQKCTFVCNEEDWELLCDVFPEVGFRTYFPGFLVKCIAEALRDKKIDNSLDRFNDPVFSNIPRLIEIFRSAWQQELDKQQPKCPTQTFPNSLSKETTARSPHSSPRRPQT